MMEVAQKVEFMEDDVLSYPDPDELPAQDASTARALTFLILLSEQPALRGGKIEMDIPSDDSLIFGDSGDEEDVVDYLSEASYNYWLFHPDIENEIFELLCRDYMGLLYENPDYTGDNMDVDYKVWDDSEDKIVQKRLSLRRCFDYECEDIIVQITRQVFSDTAEGKVLKTETCLERLWYEEEEEEWETESSDNDAPIEFYQDGDWVTEEEEDPETAAKDIICHALDLALKKSEEMYQTKVKEYGENLERSYEVYEDADGINMKKKYVRIGTEQTSTVPDDVCQSTSTERADAEVEEILTKAETRTLRVVPDNNDMKRQHAWKGERETFAEGFVNEMAENWKQNKQQLEESGLEQDRGDLVPTDV